MTALFLALAVQTPLQYQHAIGAKHVYDAEVKYVDVETKDSEKTYEKWTFECQRTEVGVSIYKLTRQLEALEFDGEKIELEESEGNEETLRWAEGEPIRHIKAEPGSDRYFQAWFPFALPVFIKNQDANFFEYAGFKEANYNYTLSDKEFAAKFITNALEGTLNAKIDLASGWPISSKMVVFPAYLPEDESNTKCELTVVLKRSE